MIWRSGRRLLESWWGGWRRWGVNGEVKELSGCLREWGMRMGMSRNSGLIRQ